MKSFWKEYTIFLKEGKEYCYNIQNENTNCIIIRNFNITNVNAGIKPHTYEVIIDQNQTGLINRPFPLDYIYLFSNKSTPVSIIETIIQNPVNNFIQQKVTKNIIVQNTPQVYEEAYKIISVQRSIYIPPHRPIRRPEYFDFDITLDCGIYGRPLVNIFIMGGGDVSRFHIGFSNDNINYFFPYTNLRCESDFYPPSYARNHITLVNAFRYVRVIARLDKFPARGEYFYARISATRYNIRNIRNLVTPAADGGIPFEII